MAIDGIGATSDEINGALSLVGLHHRQVQDDGLALAQRLDGFGHLIEAARFHHQNFRSSGGDAGHADHIGAGEGIAIVEAADRCDRAAALKAGIGGLQAVLVLQLSAVVVIEVVVTSDNLLETRKNGHRREPL